MRQRIDFTQISDEAMRFLDSRCLLRDHLLSSPSSYVIPPGALMRCPRTRAVRPRSCACATCHGASPSRERAGSVFARLDAVGTVVAHLFSVRNIKRVALKLAGKPTWKKGTPIGRSPIAKAPDNPHARARQRRD